MRRARTTSARPGDCEESRNGPPEPLLDDGGHARREPDRDDQRRTGQRAETHIRVEPPERCPPFLVVVGGEDHEGDLLKFLFPPDPTVHEERQPPRCLADLPPQLELL